MCKHNDYVLGEMFICSPLTSRVSHIDVALFAATHSDAHEAALAAPPVI